MSEKEKITPVKLAASVLAAVTAAVLSLRLNVAGTIIGAVIASVVTTVGAVLYQRSMEREKRWQVIAIGGLLAFVVAVLVVTSVQLVTGKPVGADPAKPSAPPATTVTHTETSTPPSTETITVTAPPSTSGQSPTESTTTTGPSTTSTGSQQPTDSSTPPSTVDPIR